MKEERGFTVMELALVLSVFAILSFSFYRIYLGFKNESDIRGAETALLTIENGIKKNYMLIIETFEPICSVINQFTPNDLWGWRHFSCSSTSPLPEWDANSRELVYHVNFNSLAGSQATSIGDQIASSLYPACHEISRNNTEIRFSCDGNIWINAMYFVTPFSGNVYRFHNLGSALDFFNFPSIFRVEYDLLLTGTGQRLTGRTYDVDLSDIYLYSVTRTREKLARIVDTLKQYAQTRINAEFGNPQPSGLAELDDFFVPWNWQVLAANQASAYTTCGNSTCSNFANTNIWPASWQVTGFAFVWSRVVANLFNGNLTVVVDGFGNPWRLLPISNGCGANLSFCGANNQAPPRPQPNYSSVYGRRPPYTSYVVSPLCLTGVNPFNGQTVPDWCRMPVVYGN